MVQKQKTRLYEPDVIVRIQHATKRIQKILLEPLLAEISRSLQREFGG